MKKLFLMAAMLLVLSGCGAKGHRVLQSPTRSLASFQQVDVRPFTVNAGVGEALKPEQKQAFSQMVESISVKLQERLRDSGRALAAGSDALIIEGTISQYNPGNQALRYFVGFGAGASKLYTQVKFKDGRGNAIGATEFVGGVTMGVFGGDKSGGVNRLVDEIADYILVDRP